jgi:hypothetical protein
MIKRIFITVFVLFAFMATGVAQTQAQVISYTSCNLNELAEKTGVTAMTISKSMLDMFPDMTASVEKNGLDIKKISNQIDQIDIFVSKSQVGKVNITKTHKELARGTYNEVFMRIKDETTNIVFYGFKDSNKIIRSLMMYINNEKECVLIRLVGGLTEKDISEIIKTKQENDEKNKKKE